MPCYSDDDWQWLGGGWVLSMRQQSEHELCWVMSLCHQLPLLPPLHQSQEPPLHVSRLLVWAVFRSALRLLIDDEDAQPQLRTLVCVILAELIGPLPLNSPDWSCQNYNCVSQFLASRSCVMRRVWAVMLSSSHLFVQTPFIPRVKLSERSPPANQRAHFGFLTNQKTEERGFSLCKVSSHFPERENILCFD